MEYFDWLGKFTDNVLLHMTSYGPLSVLHTIVERQYNEELYFNQIVKIPCNFILTVYNVAIRLAM